MVCLEIYTQPEASTDTLASNNRRMAVRPRRRASPGLYTRHVSSGTQSLRIGYIHEDPLSAPFELETLKTLLTRLSS